MCAASHRAAYNGRKDAARLLIKAGASLSATTRDGNTALHLACFMNHLGMIELLMELDARQDLMNGMRQVPLDLCVTDAARELLRAFGFGFVRQQDSKSTRSTSTPPVGLTAPSTCVLCWARLSTGGLMFERALTHMLPLCVQVRLGCKA